MGEQPSNAVSACTGLHLQPILWDSLDQSSTLLNCAPLIRIWNRLLQQSAKQENTQCVSVPRTLRRTGRMETRSGSGSAPEGQGPEALWIKPPRDSSPAAITACFSSSGFGGQSTQAAVPRRLLGPVVGRGTLWS